MLYSGVNEERYTGLARKLRAAARHAAAAHAPEGGRKQGTAKVGNLPKVKRDAACRRHPK